MSCIYMSKMVVFNTQVHTCLMIWCSLHFKTACFHRGTLKKPNIFCRRKYKMLTKNQTPWKNFRCTPKLEAVLAPIYFANEGQCAYLCNGGMKWLMFVKCSESIFSCLLIYKADFHPRLKKSTSLHFSIRWVYSQGTNT